MATCMRGVASRHERRGAPSRAEGSAVASGGERRRERRGAPSQAEGSAVASPSHTMATDERGNQMSLERQSEDRAAHLAQDGRKQQQESE